MVATVINFGPAVGTLADSVRDRYCGHLNSGCRLGLGGCLDLEKRLGNCFDYCYFGRGP
jgi:hypothetical protein